MKKHLIAAALLVACGQATASNFAECILDRMPGAANQAMHAAIWRTCRAEHPTGYLSIRVGSGRGIFGYKSGDACTIKKAANTPFSLSAQAIGAACRCLYNEPNPFDKPDAADMSPVMCDYPRDAWGNKIIPARPK